MRPEAAEEEAAVVVVVTEEEGKESSASGRLPLTEGGGDGGGDGASIEKRKVWWRSRGVAPATLPEALASPPPAPLKLAPLRLEALS